MANQNFAKMAGFRSVGHKYQAGLGVIIWGQNPQTFMIPIPIYSTTVLYDDKNFSLLDLLNQNKQI